MKLTNLSKILFLLAFISIQCKNNPQKASAELKEALFYMKTTQCLGECPAFTFTVYANGASTYEGTAFVDNIGDFTGKLSAEQLENLKAELVSSDFFNIKIEKNNLIKDKPSTYLFYNDGKQSDTILYYYPKNKDADQIIKFVNTLINELAWSKD